MSQKTGPFFVILFALASAVSVALAGCSGSKTTPSPTPVSMPTPPAAPVFTPPAGTYSSPQSVQITSSTAGAQILYSTSSTAAPSMTYSGPISVATSSTLYAVAVSGGISSASVSSSYTINGSVPVPTISPAGGTFTATETVTLADSQAGSVIHYTLDGSAPTANSAVYISSFQISKSGVTTVQAIATATDYLNSAIASSTFTLNLSPLPTPTISPAGGTFTSAQTVTLSDTQPGVTLYYTLDGSVPTTGSTIYAAPISITNGTTTVKVIASTAGFLPSAAASATYTVFVVSSTPAYSWKNVQVVGGGFVDGLYFHPKSQGLMFAKTDIGGAYRWNNVTGGDTQWVPLLNFVGRFNSGFDQGVDSLALDPADPSKLYLAVGEYADSYGSNGVILISSDMGATFTPVQLPVKMGSNDIGRNIGERLVVDPNNSKHLYLATRSNGLFESVDGAHTWSQNAAFPVTGPSSNPEDPEALVGVTFEDFIPSSGLAANGNTRSVYVGVASPTVGLYVSNDGGGSFQPVPGQPTGYYLNATAVDTANGILYATYGVNSGCMANCDNSGPYGPNAGQVWKYVLPTTNSPAGTWTNITPPQTTPAGGMYSYGSIVVDPSHSNVVMLTLLNKYYPQPLEDIFRSLDGGSTWVNLNTNMQRDLSLSPWVSFGQTNSQGKLAAGPGNWSNHLVVDPFNSNHAMYGSGQTIWQTTDIQDADGVPTTSGVVNHANPTKFSIGALGLEETDITGLVSPASGPANLITVMGDLGGFTHTDLTHSPAGGTQANPQFTSGYSVDFAQNSPLQVVRVGSPAYAQTQAGAYSSDGGVSWTAFKTQPTGFTSGGTIAIAADGSNLVWLSSDSGVAVSYSTDHGVTWTASTGAPAQTSNYNQVVVKADRVNPLKFYAFNPGGNNGATPLSVSTDGGKTFTTISSPTYYASTLNLSPAAEGDLWLTSYQGLFHSTDSGATFAPVPGTSVSYNLGFGMAAPGATYPTLFLIGQQANDTACTSGNDPSTQFTIASTCIYRSVDGGVTFQRTNDFAHQFGYINTLTGDSRVFGRVYLGTAGRGIVQGDSPN